MPDVEDAVLAQYFERLAEVDNVSADLVDGLSRAFADGKLPKVDQLVQLIAETTREAVK